MNKETQIPPEVEYRLRSGYTLGVWLPPGTDKPVYAIRDYVLDDIYLAAVDLARWGDSGRLIRPDQVMTYTCSEEWGFLKELTVGQFKNGIIFETIGVWTHIPPDQDVKEARSRVLLKLTGVLELEGCNPEQLCLWNHDEAIPLPPATDKMPDLDCKKVKVVTTWTYM